MTSLCDGSDLSLLSTTTPSCTFAVADAISELSYARGDLLLVKARARNSEGFGQFSSPNSSGALIETVPSLILDPEVSAYTMTSITLTWPELLFNNENGASSITSYSLEWDQGTGSFTSLIGDPVNSLATSYEVTGLTTGSPYAFRLTARNKHGWSESYSNTVTWSPAGPPGTPDPVTTEIDNIYVRFSWEEPETNGAEIISYSLSILKADGFTLAATSSCDGENDPLIVQNRECLVPMSELTSVYGLPQGRTVSAKLQAINIAGTSDFSAYDTTSAVLVEVVPHAPANARRGALTTESEIEIEWDELATATKIGGATCTILSYRVEWDQGAGDD